MLKQRSSCNPRNRLFPQLEIFSHNGYTLIEGSSDIVNNRASFFQGTLANITLKCDESSYHFSDEPSQDPYF
jgi:hypothetical protein